MTDTQEKLTLVNIGTPTSSPIMISLRHNEIMDRWDVILTVGNFVSEHQANAAANKLIKLVERDLGSKRTTTVQRN
jgi:hypothetical protein